MKKIKVMSFNMRTQVEADGVNQFRQRKERILSMLNSQDPDVIGFQEVTDEMRAWLRSALGEKYTVVGCGRMSDYTGEAVAIALRNDMFELIENLQQEFENILGVPINFRRDWISIYDGVYKKKDERNGVVIYEKT